VRRIQALDGLRGVAILLVTGYHFYGRPSGGFFGVDLFFVLSGFLITTLLLEEHATSGAISLAAFYVRRARRLMPAAGLVLLLFLPLVGWRVAAMGGLYAANFVRAFAHPDPLYAMPFDHFWSLAQEEQFYLLWPPLLIFLLRRLSRRRLIAVLSLLFAAVSLYRVGLAASGESWSRLYFGPDTHASGLILGCLAAAARPRVSPMLGRAGLLVVVVLAFVGSPTMPWELVGLPAAELAAVLAVISAASNTHRVLSAKPFVWLGGISYSLYLWQQPVRWLFGFDMRQPTIPLALTVVVAWLSAVRVERRFRYRRSHPEAVPAPAVA
jgi:peptidoglycan/LPS O-acetylase OafA/YrhL